MAGSKDDPNLQLCKKCNVKVASGIKCVKCESYFHPSCAKRCAYVKIVDEVLTCCVRTNEIQTLDDNDDNLDQEEVPKIFKYILRQKDTIIMELREKIQILKEQLELQKELLKLKGVDPKIDEVNERIVQKADKPIDRQKSTLKKIDKQTPADLKTSTLKQSQLALLRAKSNLGSDDTPLDNNDVTAEASQTQTNQPNNTTWSKVVQRRPHGRPSRKVPQIVGESTISSLKVAPRKGFIYVSRLAPDTTADEVCELLKPEFPEVTCHQLETKYPQYYSAFKVTVHLHNFETALKPNHWPSGCYVTRYFHRKTEKKETS